MNQPTIAKLPAMDAEDIATMNRAKREITKVIKQFPQSIVTLAFLEIIHEIASGERCPAVYRQLVAPLLAKLSEDITQIDAAAPKIALDG